MTKRADVTLVSLLALCACFSAPAAYGQAASTGAIQGTIADPSGAAVPGVEVTATNVATGRSVKALTRRCWQGSMTLRPNCPGSKLPRLRASGLIPASGSA